MKRLKEYTVIKLAKSSTFIKKFAPLFCLGVVMFVGLVKYIVSHSFGQAISYLFWSFLIAFCILSIIRSIARSIAKKQIKEYYEDSIIEYFDSEELKEYVLDNNIENNKKEDSE